MRNTKSVIKVENIAQKVLLDSELLGQFSDGFWENSRNESWRYLDSVEVANSKDEIGVQFESRVPYGYKAYSVNNKELLSYVGERMLLKARIAKALNISDVKDIETITNSYKLEIKIANNTQFCKEGFLSIIEKWEKDTDGFWSKRAEKIRTFIKEIGGIDTLVDAANSNYTMKDMRKDLRAITQTLKTPYIA